MFILIVVIKPVVYFLGKHSGDTRKSLSYTEFACGGRLVFKFTILIKLKSLAVYAY